MAIKKIPGSYVLEGVNVKELINPKFLDSLKIQNGELIPVSIVFAYEHEVELKEGKHKHADFATVGHETSTDVQNNRVSVNSDDTDFLEELIKIIERFKEDGS